MVFFNFSRLLISALDEIAGSSEYPNYDKLALCRLENRQPGTADVYRSHPYVQNGTFRHPLSRPDEKKSAEHPYDLQSV